MADVNRNITVADPGLLDTTYIQAKAIDTLEQALVFTEFTTPGELPMNAGSTLRWHIDRNFEGTFAFNALTNNEDLGGSGAELTYGTRDTMNEETFLTDRVERQINTYGVFIPIRRADLEDMPATVMDRISNRLGYRGAEVLDTLVRVTLDGNGLNADGFFPGFGTGTGTVVKENSAGGDPLTLEPGDTLSAEGIGRAVGALWANNAVEFSDGRYKAIVHSAAAIQLATDVSVSHLTWEGINKYVDGFGAQEKLIKGHLGAILGADVMRTTNLDTNRAVDTLSSYDNFVIAKDSIGMVSRGDFEPAVHVNQSGSGSMSDPHRQWATLAFQFQAAPQLLDELRAVRLSSAQI